MKLLPVIREIGWMVAVAALTLTIASSAQAQTVTVDRCAAAKMRCVMGYTHVCGVAGVLGLFKCHQTATLKGRFVDQVCMTRTVDEIVECFRNAERRNFCRTTGDVLAIQSQIEAFVTDAVRDVTPGFPYPIVNRCAAGKQQTIAEATAGKLGCFEDAARREPGLVDTTCFTKAEGAYDSSWAKLENNGGCLTQGDSGPLEAKLEAFVADMVEALDP